MVYASPESLEHSGGSSPAASPASDVYSLGALLYFLLTGRPPSVSRERETLLEQIEAGQFPPPRQVNRHAPRELQAICLKALQREPAHRYGGPKELMLEVQRWLAGQPVQAENESLWRGLLRTVRSRPALFVWIMAGMSLATAFLIILALVLNQERRDAERAKGSR